MLGFKKRKGQNPCTIKVPPEGMTVANITVQSSICTGETLIGFLDGRTGHLLQAVVVRNQKDIDSFYRDYGYESPCRK